VLRWAFAAELSDGDRGSGDAGDRGSSDAGEPSAGECEKTVRGASMWPKGGV
jgi:hypothetical protein